MHGVKNDLDCIKCFIQMENKCIMQIIMRDFQGSLLMKAVCTSSRCCGHLKRILGKIDKKSSISLLIRSNRKICGISYKWICIFITLKWSNVKGWLAQNPQRKVFRKMWGQLIVFCKQIFPNYIRRVKVSSRKKWYLLRIFPKWTVSPRATNGPLTKFGVVCRDAQNAKRFAAVLTQLFTKLTKR